IYCVHGERFSSVFQPSSLFRVFFVVFLGESRVVVRVFSCLKVLFVLVVSTRTLFRVLFRPPSTGKNGVPGCGSCRYGAPALSCSTNHAHYWTLLSESRRQCSVVTR
ncbi:unnamed protein product, partial [Ectocarpus sp. 12 AP-2014]